MHPKRLELKDWIKSLYVENKYFKITPIILKKFIFLLKESELTEFNDFIVRIDELIHFILCNSYYYETPIPNYSEHLETFETYTQILLRKLFGTIFMCISNEYLLYNNEYDTYKYLNGLKQLNPHELVLFTELINRYTLFNNLKSYELKVMLKFEFSSIIITYLLEYNIHDYDEEIKNASNFIRKMKSYKAQNIYLDTITLSHKRKLCDEEDNANSLLKICDGENMEEQTEPLLELKKIHNENKITFIGSYYYFIQ